MPVQPPGKELVSSVKGWLLFKSAMDLWEDVVNEDNTHATVSRAKSLPKAGTLGRFNSQDLIEPSPVAVTPRTVKRTKSLWRFKNKKNNVLEGMALWKHRSLIDIADTNVPQDAKEENIYSSAEEVKSVESVIMVEDHVSKDAAIPRTKLIKDPKKKDFQTWNPSRQKEAARWAKEGTVKYGPWYDLWGVDASVKG